MIRRQMAEKSVVIERLVKQHIVKRHEVKWRRSIFPLAAKERGMWRRHTAVSLVSEAPQYLLHAIRVGPQIADAYTGDAAHIN